jgi:hypothetical protein
MMGMKGRRRSRLTRMMEGGGRGGKEQKNGGSMYFGV